MNIAICLFVIFCIFFNFLEFGILKLIYENFVFTNIHIGLYKKISHSLDSFIIDLLCLTILTYLLLD